MWCAVISASSSTSCCASTPMITFLENPLYNEANNISSIVVAKRPSVQRLRHRVGSAPVQSIPFDEVSVLFELPGHSPSKRSDDWCLSARKGVVTGVSVGGENCWQMVGISYWNAEDGRRLAEDVPATFGMPGGKERYWDEVPLTYFADNYEVHVRECRADDIVEIDTFKELQAIDSAYACC